MISASAPYEHREETAVFGGVKYLYRVAPPSSSTGIWCLLLHGAANGAYTLRFVVPALVSAGYRVVIPDLLGYGGTEKPVDEAYLGMYSMRKMTQSLAEIMEKEGTTKFVAIGHDFGTVPANRLALYYPDRITALVLVCVAYTPPAPFDPQIRSRLKALLGYDNFGYWDLLTADDAETVIGKNPGAYVNQMYAKDPLKDKIKMTGDATRLREFIMNDERIPQAEYLTQTDFETYVAGLSNGSLQSRFNWYKATIKSISWDDGDKDLPPIKSGSQIHIPASTPVLSILCKQDVTVPPALGALQGNYIEDLTVVTLDADHWPMEMMPDEFNGHLLKWLKDKVI